MIFNRLETLQTRSANLLKLTQDLSTLDKHRKQVICHLENNKWQEKTHYFSFFWLLNIVDVASQCFVMLCWLRSQKLKQSAASFEYVQERLLRTCCSFYKWVTRFAWLSKSLVWHMKKTQKMEGLVNTVFETTIIAKKKSRCKGNQEFQETKVSN